MTTPSDVVIVEAVRTPVGRRNGGLSTNHPADTLGTVLSEVVHRSGIGGDQVGQVVTGCVSQIGEQAFNIGRTAWLTAGLPQSVATTTVGASARPRAVRIAPSGPSPGHRSAIHSTGTGRLEFTSQFEGAERIAEKWGITRSDADDFGLRSQQLAAQAWADGRFEGQITPVQAPILGEDGKPTGDTTTVSRDEGLRETTIEKLANLKAVAREDGVHTAGSSSQISDGAAALLLTTAARAPEMGLTPRARIVDTCLVGVDPVLMLTGPIDATRHLLDRTGLSIADIDTFEINEAFASVVLAWAREFDVPMEKVNPNGGAIALGHPLGATGAVLITKALKELERTGGRYGLISMCCGGGLGTGTIIERL